MPRCETRGRPTTTERTKFTAVDVRVGPNRCPFHQSLLKRAAKGTSFRVSLGMSRTPKRGTRPDLPKRCPMLDGGLPHTEKQIVCEHKPHVVTQVCGRHPYNGSPQSRYLEQMSPSSPFHRPQSGRSEPSPRRLHWQPTQSPRTVVGCQSRAAAKAWSCPSQKIMRITITDSVQLNGHSWNFLCVSGLLLCNLKTFVSIAVSECMVLGSYLSRSTLLVSSPCSPHHQCGS